MAEVLNVHAREGRGKQAAKHLRNKGAVPAILYGHNETPVSLSVCSDEIAVAVRHGAKVLTLQGAVNESAVIRELQWDVYGNEILHVDFGRVSKSERIHVQVAVELRGEAPGSHQGGLVELVLHEVTIEAPADQVPEKLVANINHLELHKALHAGELELPAGVKIVGDAKAVVVHCVEPAAESDEASDAGAEPEVIGRKESTDEA